MSTSTRDSGRAGGGERERTTGGRLSPGWRRAVLVVHLIAGVGWLGVAVAVLALVALDSPAGYEAMLHLVEVLVLPPPFAIGIAASLSGVVLGLGTKWGLFRHTWVVAKMVLLFAAFTLSGLLLREPLAQAVETGTAPGALALRASAQIAVLAAITVISVFKPWGRLRRG